MGARNHPGLHVDHQQGCCLASAQRGHVGRSCRRSAIESLILRPPRHPFQDDPGLQPREALSRCGEIFAVFDVRTQDSGNVSFGIVADGERWFVKTAGDPADAGAPLPHPARVALLQNAIALSTSAEHPALPRVVGAFATAWGPALVYAWAAGGLLREPPDRRGDVQTALQRFRRQDPRRSAAALGNLFDAHAVLAAAGWVAVDFYDGSLLWDDLSGQLRLIDLDLYRQGPFRNDMGRMFGSTRFMAPEEFVLGAWIDGRTTVFNLGRAAAILMGDGTTVRTAFRGCASQFAVMCRACSPDPADRFQSVEALTCAWRMTLEAADLASMGVDQR